MKNQILQTSSPSASPSVRTVSSGLTKGSGHSKGSNSDSQIGQVEDGYWSVLLSQWGYPDHSVRSLEKIVFNRFQKDKPKATSRFRTPTKIIKEDYQKPFLGGYSHKLTKTEYHHATAQTDSDPAFSPVEKFCRDTQTVQEKTQAQQTVRDAVTQVIVPGLYITDRDDKVLTPRKDYVSADELYAQFVKKVIVIQKVCRRWLARRELRRRWEDACKRQEWEKEQEELDHRTKLEQQQNDKASAIDPINEDDFRLLFSNIREWHAAEAEQIGRTKSGTAQKAALCNLLEKEQEIIAAADRLRYASQLRAKERNRQTGLRKAAAPKPWSWKKGIVNVETPATQKARELKELYISLAWNFVTIDERLDILTTLERTINEYYCALTCDIMALVDRERDLLKREVKDSYLEKLRERIVLLFWEYAKQPAVNPSLSELLKQPESGVNALMCCTSCGNYFWVKPSHSRKNSSKAVVNIRSRCQYCATLHNDAFSRQHPHLYNRMLQDVQGKEKDEGTLTGPAFLLTGEDIEYLVQQVWHSHSALSTNNNLLELVLTRWESWHEWSPWNCILLTIKEAAVHRRLKKLEEAYAADFIEWVQKKNHLAFCHFSSLPRLSPIFSNSSSKCITPVIDL